MFRKLWNFLFRRNKTEVVINKPAVSELRFPNKPIVPSTYRGNPTPVRSPVPSRRTTTNQLRAEPARVSTGSSSSSYDPTLDILTTAAIVDALTPDTCTHSEGSNNWAGSGGESGGGGASASWSEPSPSYSSPSSDSSSSYSGSSSSSSSDSYSSSSSSSYSSSSYDSGSSYSSSDSSSYSSSDSSW